MYQTIFLERRRIEDDFFSLQFMYCELVNVGAVDSARDGAGAGFHPGGCVVGVVVCDF